jgi:rubredoxin
MGDIIDFAPRKSPPKPPLCGDCGLALATRWLTWSEIPNDWLCEECYTAWCVREMDRQTKALEAHAQK